MDVLKNKSSKSYEYISRYASFPYYYHSLDKKYVYGLTSQLNANTTYTLVNVEMNTTLDGLAAKYYGRPDYYWIIADFNRIQDPFIQLSDFFNKIKIPALTSVEFES